MDDDLKPRLRRPSRGTVSIPFAAGSMSGSALTERAYTTPRYRQGLGESDLKTAPAAIQRETALWWFTLNLEPHAVRQRSAGFNFDGSGNFDGKRNFATRGTYVPDPISSYNALLSEFQQSLSEVELRSLGEALPGQWMWIEYIPPTPPTGDRSVDLADILFELRSLSQAVQDLRPERGQPGHNDPDGDFFLSASEHSATLRAVESTRAHLSTELIDVAAARHAWEEVGHIIQKVGSRALERIGVFFDGGIKAAGGAAGVALFQHLHGAAKVVDIYDRLSALLQHL